MPRKDLVVQGGRSQAPPAPGAHVLAGRKAQSVDVDPARTALKAEEIAEILGVCGELAERTRGSRRRATANDPSPPLSGGLREKRELREGENARRR